MTDLTWDYTTLAETYHLRAPYAPAFVEQVCRLSGLGAESTVCDVGAGTGFLARELAAHHMQVQAIEPNESMRRAGITQCAQWSNIHWHAGQAEQTGQPSQSADLVSFGSSFNVVDQSLALAEAKRIAHPGGWLLLVWNHRDLTDELQQQIEQIIHQHIPLYRYGSRRKSHQAMLEQSGLFSEVQAISEQFIHRQKACDVINAWHSHATLQRQAGALYEQVMQKIEELILTQQADEIATPFQSKGWLAKFK